MVKKAIAIIALFSLALLLTAQTAEITVPQANTVWNFGELKTIQWTYSGSATVKILLYGPAGTKLGPVKSGLPLAGGSFAWQVGMLENGKAVPAAKGYMLQLVRIDGASTILDKEAGPFEIAGTPAAPVPPAPPPGNMILLRKNPQPGANAITPTLRVTYPSAGAVLVQGNEAKITWTLAGGGYGDVKIMLYPAGQPQLAAAGQGRWIAQSAPNSGSFTWKLAPTERTGKHVVRVQTLDGKIHGDSGEFTISPLSPVPVLTVRALDVKDLLAQKATIAVDSLGHGMYDHGDVQGVGMIVRATSPSGFTLTPLFGHPQYGSLYARCVIEVPRTAKDGSFTAVKVHDAVYSLKGGPPFHLSAQPTQLGWADVTFHAEFDPNCQGLAVGQRVGVKQKGGAFEGGKLCIADYYPKLTVTLHLATQSGEAIAEKSIYIRYDLASGPKEVMILPGEVEVCSKRGMQSW